jgi:redox-sensitive bicupin YhaK (pirin superfamily)
VRVIKIRKSQNRGHANHGWLDSYHTFSFADYHDPEHMGFRSLRVINEDYIQGGMGFATHGHRDMEIISFILDGALEHKDTMGNTSIIRPGEVQWMCAGTGVRHSEFNPNKEQIAHLLQVWILPDKQGYAPAYDQKNFSEKLKETGFVLAVSNDGRDGSISIHQNVKIYLADIKAGADRKVGLAKNRHAWIQMTKGDLIVQTSAGQQTKMTAGDGLAISEESGLNLVAESDARFLVFDLV